ncbi:MAG: cysteine desulfurase family protein [Minisyncoccia bacterium]
MNWLPKKRIFLDYASATPILPEVFKVMEKYWSKEFYNPSAIYREALGVKNALTESRQSVARLLGISASGVIFTSGGTESDNLAILGTYEAARKSFKKPHLIISSVEHPAVVEAAREVERRGGELSIVPVGEDGTVSLEKLKSFLKKSTFLVSVGLAQGEIGTVQPLSKIGRIVREARKEGGSEYPLLHTDASQAPNYLDLALERLNADLMTLDGAKIYGPKGAGVLALRKDVRVEPTSFGGNQEGGRRAGTENVALAVGFAKALEIAVRDRAKESERLDILRKEFIDSVRQNLPQAVINGPVENRLPNIVSVSIPGLLAEFLVLKLDREGVLASVGSACSSDEREEGSPVIRALGLGDLATSTVRFSFGRDTKRRDVLKAAEIFCRTTKSVLK